MSGYVSVSRRTVRVLEFAHLCARVQDLPGDQAANSPEAERFARFEQLHPAEAALAKAIQFDAFDRVNRL